MENDIKIDMRTDMKTEDCKSKLVVVAWAELDLLRNSLEHVVGGLWYVLREEELQKLECVLDGLENLLSREEPQKLQGSVTDLEAVEDR